VNDHYLAVELGGLGSKQKLQLGALLLAELGDLFQIVILLLDVEQLDGVHLLFGEREGNDGSISHVKPSYVVSKWAVVASAAAIH